MARSAPRSPSRPTPLGKAAALLNLNVRFAGSVADVFE